MSQLGTNTNFQEITQELCISENSTTSTNFMERGQQVTQLVGAGKLHGSTSYFLKKQTKKMRRLMFT